MPVDQTMKVLQFKEIDPARVGEVGGKAASLAALMKLGGVRVPSGFCVTTGAYRAAVGGDARVAALEAQLARLWADEHDAIGRISAELRAAVMTLDVPGDVAAQIRSALADLGTDETYAVRSSATSEDSAEASFAGQHASYLNTCGADDVIDRVRRCWASLFTEQAVSYRVRNGIGARSAGMAVVVQRMVAAQAAGVLFTADPVSGDRTVVAIEAVRGLADGLVSGRETPAAYRVRAGAIIERPSADRTVLDDADVLRLAALGQQIARELGVPQDIEWCVDEDGIAVVQSRPITTLYPVPNVGDDEPHVYVSVGHQQMMTDPMTPLGLSVFQRAAGPQMHDAGSRLFVDVAARLADPAARSAVIGALGTSDPLIGGALEELVARGVVPERPGAAAALRPPTGHPPATPIPTDLAFVDELIAKTEASIERLASDLVEHSGAAVFDVIAAHIDASKGDTFDPRSLQAIMAGMEAAWWLNEHVEAWLGDRNVADVLAQSVPRNITSEMGLALLDVADVIRPLPAVVALLEAAEDDGFLDELPRVRGGAEAKGAIDAFLTRYGMRCVGEIDLGRDRWAEHPLALVPVLLGNVRNFAPGAGPRRFETGRREAEAKARDILARIAALPGGEEKAQETAEMIDRLRTFSGYREYPKYGIVRRFFLYKQALLREADRLVAAGNLEAREDCLFLRFEEFRDAAGGAEIDRGLIDARRADLAAHAALTPPRVMTSDGEVLSGSYAPRELPPGALPGLAVSSGTVEGRARVIGDLADADLEPGDILVTAFTDPSWTPAFVTAAGLVTEVGGTMTHGAVIAREYGLPAVVGVERAMQLIADGDRIRVHGTDGFVEVLDGASRG